MEEPRDDPPTHMMTPSTFLHFQNSPAAIQARANNLYDGHELRALASHLSQALTPRWSPRGGSELYDSYELKAVARQLNGALRAASKTAVPLYSDPKCIGHLQKKLGKQHKLIKAPAPSEVEREGKERGIVTSLWKRVKRAILRIKRGST